MNTASGSDPPRSGPRRDEAGGSKRSSPRKFSEHTYPYTEARKFGIPIGLKHKHRREFWRGRRSETDSVRSGPSGRGRPRAARRIFVQGGGGGGWARRCRRRGPIFAVLGGFGLESNSKSPGCTRFLVRANLELQHPAPIIHIHAGPHERGGSPACTSQTRNCRPSPRWADLAVQDQTVASPLLPQVRRMRARLLSGCPSLVNDRG